MYNISKVTYQDLTTFFGVPDLPFPDVPSDALTEQHLAKDFWTSQMLIHLNLVTKPDADPDNRGPATINFVRELFNAINYPDVMKKRFMISRLKLRDMASQGRPQRWTSALGTTPMPSYWSSNWTGSRAGLIRNLDLFRMPLLPSITT